MKTTLEWKSLEEEKPNPYKRVICFSSLYPKESEMRIRIIQGQFVSICSEIELWAYLPTDL